jgi:hypothetical protein
LRSAGVRRPASGVRRPASGPGSGDPMLGAIALRGCASASIQLYCVLPGSGIRGPGSESGVRGPGSGDPMPGADRFASTLASARPGCGQRVGESLEQNRDNAALDKTRDQQPSDRRRNKKR